MNNFTKKELIMSLICPIWCFIWGAGRFFSDLNNIRIGTYYLIPSAAAGISAMAVGGILCAILTVRLNIHTEKYLIKRLVVGFAAWIAEGFITSGSMFLFWFSRIMVMLAGLLIEVVYIQDKDNTPSERAVILLSDVVLYWLIFDLLYAFVSSINI